MELGVGSHKGRWIVCCDGPLSSLLQVAEAFDMFGGGVLGGEPGGLCFQHGADSQQFVGFGIRRDMDECAVGRPLVDPPLGMQAHQSLSDRLSANPQDAR